ncbi:MAG: 4Fe-4S binding protein [Candidatus Marinimicrobia bacterium]|jgi:NADH-quinone oxidoreductase subunit I|nr:4Fe-4S binding protein [Candidatus Neomarinimicrobiota bacterium]
MSEYLNNIVYGVKSFLTGMKLTMDHFRNKKELVATLQYPHEKWPIPERNIGFNHSEYNLIRSRLHVDIDDCIACMQCERACPVDCIKIDSIKPPKGSEIDCGMTSNDTQKKMIVSRFTIDMSECMYCNLCVFPCPEDCIYMVGGPNAEKHEIDYEFSQYKRDGMIFDFADTTDEAIRDAGGEKWLDQRDATLTKHNDGVQLKGEVKSVKPEPTAAPIKTGAPISTTKPAAQTTESSGELEIKSFNGISDKMCRGIAKKAFMAAKRAGKDAVAILADVAQALSEAGKMSDEIQSILDRLSVSPSKAVAPAVEAGGDIKVESVPDTPEAVEMKEFDIKDLNAIEDKMVRGTAKKAFIAAKRSGEDKVEAVRKTLADAGKLDAAAEDLLNSFSGASVELSAPVEVATLSESAEEAAVEPKGDLPLFEISDLNGIDDKMTRGMAKKIFMVGKRAGKTRTEVIADLRLGLTEAGKLDDATDAILNKLKSEN